ncbi:hypothetical protein SAMN06265365_104222 [Tistlia consotensis]|uniref:4-amino-4-deoxy-L-arabinose transferase n=1 Tax=Tistlia consotensis USBA 355 TaxID=560819 RepID=A0A1Y6BNX6_9PROT|nr:hypothetical protein [Tistlia consotensis]SMF21037.1 hypothetical protein SAMN05428998_10772 [Tistlia consotensis USBA 355]SNR47251.1 hypothetical protein SAMN06265365_104222 [Tistlia consotensis]
MAGEAVRLPGTLDLRRWSLILTTGIAVAVVLSGLEPAMHWRTVGDDAYYYYGVARGLVEHGRPTFDGLTLASGYHPLFLAICTMLYALLGAALPAAVVVLAALALAVHGAVCLKLAEQLALGPISSLLFGLMLVANPALLQSVWMIGLESLLAVPLLAGFLLVCLRAVDAPEEAPGRLPSAAALMILLIVARLDLAIVAAPVFAFAFRRRPLGVVLGGGALAVVLGAYMLVHLSVFGSPLPASADAMRLLSRPLVERHLHAVLHTGYYIDFLEHPLRFVMNALRSLRFAVGVPSGVGEVSAGRLLAGALLLAVAVAVAAVLRPVGWTKLRRDPRAALAAVVVLFVLLLVYAGTVRIYYLRPWYHGLNAVALALAGWILVARHLRPLGHAWLLPAAYGAVLLGFGVAAFTESPPAFPLRRAEVARAAVAILPADARIGAFNAGIYGWAAPERIVNLDGLVNEAAFAAIRDGRLARYIWDEAGLRYLLDVDPADSLVAMIDGNERSPLRLNLEPMETWSDGRDTHTLWRIVCTVGCGAH